MEQEDKSYHIRNLLERVSKQGAYTKDDQDFLEKMYYRGRSDLQWELQNLLGVDHLTN